MRRDLLVIAAIILVVVVAIAIITFSPGPTLPDIHSVSTDKDLYHSNEVMMVSIEVT